MNVTFVNHITGEIIDGHDAAMEIYRQGIQVDLYIYSSLFKEWMLRGSWVVD